MKSRNLFPLSPHPLSLIFRSVFFLPMCTPSTQLNSYLSQSAVLTLTFFFLQNCCVSNFGESLQKHIVLALGTKVSIGLNLHTKIGGSSRVDVSAPVVVAKTSSPYNHILHFGCTAKKPTVSLGQQIHSYLEMSLARWFIYRCNFITRCKNSYVAHKVD